MRRVLVAIVTMLCAFAVWAHEIRPAYLEIRENADHSLSITWKQPVMGEVGVPLRPSISAGWLSQEPSEKSATDIYLIKRWNVPATHEPLDGQTIHIDGLDRTMTDVLVQVVLAGEETHAYLMKPVQPSIVLSLSKPEAPPVWQYIQLGIFHIWTGFDHLLFVFGLILLVPNRSKLFWTITSFTVAHSITLALATLGIVHVPSAFVEACIALSIVFLAVELVRNYRGHGGLTTTYPWIVSFVFGLMHGLGFASALEEVGLPHQSIPLALFLFNVGVEIGQLVFVLAVLFLLHLGRRFTRVRAQEFRWVPAYVIGCTAAFWFFERLMACLT